MDPSQVNIQDAQHSAYTEMKSLSQDNDAAYSGISYTVFSRRLKVDDTINQRLLQLKMQRNKRTTLPPVNIHPLHIPTPKSHKVYDTLNGTTWMNFSSTGWQPNATSGWNVPYPVPPPPPLSLEPTINTAYNTNLHSVQ